jgi:hypothetical protein
MKQLFGVALLAAAVYGAWAGLSQMDLLPQGLKLQGEYGAMLKGPR